MESTYSFHIQFTDGTNPYFSFPCDRKKHLAQLRKWRKNYDLSVISRSGNLVFLLASQKITR